VVFVWVVATVGVTYVANAAVELVDLQVFPQGARIEVLARAQPTPPTLPRVRATTAPPPPTTTVPAPATTVAAPTTTVAAPVVATTTVVTTTTAAPPVATTTVVATTTAAPPVATTTAAPPVATTTAAPPVATTTAAPPVTTTTAAPPVTTTTTMAPVVLVMTDSVLADGRTGSAYRARLVMDGSAPFTWDVESGVLPAGLSLSGDGFLEGTPTGSGRYVFTVGAVDESDRTGTAEYSIVVKEFRVVTARGGSVTVIVQGNSVAFFSALQAEGFDQVVLVRSGPIVVEVQFLPSSGDDTSWVRCEAADGVVCSHG